MGSIYPRGQRLWLRHKDRDGKWTSSATGLAVGQERQAEKLLEVLEAQLGGAVAPAAARPRRRSTAADRPARPTPGLTVLEWYALWKPRRVRMAAWADEESRLRVHILPELGALRLTEVRPRHLAALVRNLQSKLAPRTVRVVYSAARVLFRDAVVEELLPANPCVLTKDQLGKLCDRDPEWRAGAVFSRDELAALISDPRLPPDRHLLYALKGVAGLRDAEVNALTWRQWDTATTPLGRLDIFITKSKQPRRVPVHPQLAAQLAAWKHGGWTATHGRLPEPDDQVLPREGDAAAHRNRRYSQHRLLADLDLLGLRRRRGHDLRRTMISLARADGARRDVLQAVTHGTRSGIVDVYTEWPWETLCEAVACLRLPGAEKRGGGGPDSGVGDEVVEQEAELVEAAEAVEAVASGTTVSAIGGVGNLATVFATVPPNTGISLSSPPRSPCKPSSGRRGALSPGFAGLGLVRGGVAADGSGDGEVVGGAETGPNCSKECGEVCYSLRRVIAAALAALEAGRVEEAVERLRGAEGRRDR